MSIELVRGELERLFSLDEMLALSSDLLGLDPKDVGKQKKPNTGHLHFQMDGGKFDYPRYSGANGKLAVTLGIAGKYSPAVLPTITYRHLPPGKHRLVVFLANNDHSPVGASASVRFTVR